MEGVQVGSLSVWIRPRPTAQDACGHNARPRGGHGGLGGLGPAVLKRGMKYLGSTEVAGAPAPR